MRAARALVAFGVVVASAALSFVVADRLGLVVTVERRGEAGEHVGVRQAADAGAQVAADGDGVSRGAAREEVPGAVVEPVGDAPPAGTVEEARAGAAATAAWIALASADVDSPESLTVIVNKQRPLDPLDHAPSDLVAVAGAEVRLRDEAAESLARLRRAAEKAGVPLVVHSAYRSFEEQERTFDGWVAELGEELAAARSARAGHSEHQTGLAVDVVAMTGACRTMECFGETPQAAWLAEHAHEHGWVVRFQDGAESVTGYDAEPWHLRYVGKDVARAAHDSGLALESLFGLPAAPGY